MNSLYWGNPVSLTFRFCFIAAVATGLLTGCASTTGHYGQPGTPVRRLGDEIMVAGQLFHTGAPVVRWTDQGGYDAYRVECQFNPDAKLPTGAGAGATPNRYSTLRRNLPEDVREDVRLNGWSLDELREYVDLFVLHYDACGTSRRCFTVLHDLRGLSVHFMLDVDGTIYQTLDVKERAWHAGKANDRSIGIEIANIGAYPDMSILDKWYARDANGETYLMLPDWVNESGIRTPGFVAKPARNEPVRGNIQGRDLFQYDLTNEQYESLIKLTATLCTVLPRIAPDYPRDEAGRLRTTAFTAEELDEYSGILGHYHVTTSKIDPGPAFDWERLIEGVRATMGHVAR